MEKSMKKLGLKKQHLFLAISAVLLMQTANALDEMNDKQLSDSVGQGEFLTVKNIAPNDEGNPNNQVGFTRITMNATVEMNNNMKKLRLGCDNANYTNCDISIDNLSLTGFVKKIGGGGQWTNAAPVQGPLRYPKYGTITEKWKYTIGEEVAIPLLGSINQYAGVTEGERSEADAGPTTDFVLDNPFIELAIQNPESLTDRKMVGYRFGAHEAWGIMNNGTGPAQQNNDPSAHTGINMVSGRFPQRLDNGAVEVRGRLGGVLTPLKSAIVAGNYNLNQVNSVRGGPTNLADFGRVSSGSNSDYDDKNYLRNVWLGDNDTNYTSYVGKPGESVQGRALEMKRSTQAVISNMIPRARPHPTEYTGGLGTLAGLLGDQHANQTMDLKLLHQLEIGEDINGNLKYDKGEGAKHFAFQFQTLDGLQWQTTNDSYKVNGYNDWLSTRAGWWLEMPLSSIRDFYVPYSMGVDVGTINLGQPLTLGNLDLGIRPVDNCYGSLTFC